MREQIWNRISVEKSFVESQIQEYRLKGKKVFMSSSFQTHSIPMLHLLSTIDKSIPIYFLDTGFHFPETIVYRDRIKDLLELKVVSIKANVAKIDLLGKDNKFLFSSDPDLCCQINKVDTLNSVSKLFDVWITGIRGSQNPNRKNLEYEARTEDGVLRFHPMINWTDPMINAYSYKYKLPSHPLDKHGYSSIGCGPCTTKPVLDQRSGRWLGSKKTECGLHLNLK